jgi:hypothetical protein
MNTENHLDSVIKELELDIAELNKKLERIEKAYSMRSTDVWLKHNMSPHDYLCKEISEALYGTGE